MWFRVFECQAILYKCSELLLFEGDTPPPYQRYVVAFDDEHNSVEGDANKQRRLSCLLKAWTDKDVDRKEIMRIFQVEPRLGS